MTQRTPATNATTLLGLVTGPVRARRWWLRALVKLTGGSIGVLLVIAAVIAYLVSLRPDVAAARTLARSELRVLLEPTERVHAAAWARRREWWDGYRETYGILALTDRRALFVGMPPRELVSPERGPQPFVLMQLGRDESLRARRRRVDLGSAAGVVLENDRGQRLAFASNDDAGVDSLLADVARGRRSASQSAELATRARRYEQDVTARAVWHVVAAGDALASVAARYGTSEAQLTAWNRLPGTTIRIGQRLLVKPGR
ncbi:MAG TPA: LysM peptidoglycan-binding domain-containing protein [Gemmatimonadaceae bacterium]|nr:LysM peptidoglycan-binding domain-containing protein [Gemmatimonadaceae bacterium]